MMTLVIMAAGMGSRYGGLKQIDPVGRHGEFILDYSVYDAVKAGFDKVVFIIKKENLDVFRETVGKRLEKVIPVEYAFQEITEVPEGVKAAPNPGAQPMRCGAAGIWWTVLSLSSTRMISMEGKHSGCFMISSWNSPKIPPNIITAWPATFSGIP